MKYTVIVEEGPASFGAYVPDLPGCVAAAGTREEVLGLIRDAIVMHLEALHLAGERPPPPTCTSVIVDIAA
jgi:predicted RNase H-like HicB family nuclease